MSQKYEFSDERQIPREIKLSDMGQSTGSAYRIIKAIMMLRLAFKKVGFGVIGGVLVIGCTHYRIRNGM